MELTAQIRDVVGTAAANAWRKKGFVVAEVYGLGLPNAHVAVPTKEFVKAYKEVGETSVITLKAGTEQSPVMVHDVVRDSLSGVVLHADFRRVNMNELIVAYVPIEFIGESPAVKDGGVLVKSVAEIEVEALPAHMPHSFTANLAALLEIGSSLHVKDLELDAAMRAHVTIKTEPETAIATVIAPREEEVAEVAPMTMEDVKVETDEEKAKRDAEKAAEGSDEKKPGEKSDK